MERRKKITVTLVLFFFFLLPCVEVLGEEVDLSPIMHMLLCSKGEESICVDGQSVAGGSSLGGAYGFYDVMVKIDGGPVNYLSSLPGQAHKGEDYGYRFGFYPKPGQEYMFQLQAGDSLGLMGEASDFSSPFSLVEEEGAASEELKVIPIADAGENQVVTTETTVQLDGSGSYDGVTGDSEGLMYNWEVHYSKETITLTGSDTATPEFTPPEEGEYIFRLQVSKAAGEGLPPEYSQVRYVTIKAFDDVDSALIVNVGGMVRVPLGETVTLSGRGSVPSPSEGGAYRWKFMNGAPLGSSAVIEDPTLPEMRFTPDVTGTYIFRLSVYDGELFDYDVLYVSVYDKEKVGGLLEQKMSVKCGFSCLRTDLNGDEEITQADMDIFRVALGATKRSENYLKGADLNRDAVINSLDEEIFTDCLKRTEL